jgi:energy-converting hydrogenase Eha subunit F
MTFLNNPAVLPWLPVIMLATVLIIGVLIRYSGENQEVPPAPPPPQH